MKISWKPPQAEAVWRALEKYKYVLLLVVVGLALLLWPTGGTPKQEEGGGTPQDFDLAATEEKLARVLSQVEGAGRVTVALTVKSGPEQVHAADRSTSVTEGGSSVEEKTVVIDTGSGEQTVVRLERAPVFQGAVVVSQGGGEAQVRLLLTQAVAALTGLGADRITVCKGSFD